MTQATIRQVITESVPALHAMAMFLALLMTTTAVTAQSSDAVTVEQLREELAERDRIIIELMHRVDALEGRLGDEEEPRAQVTTTQPAGSSRSTSGFEIDELAAERALERSLVQSGARLLGPGQFEVTPGLAYARNESDLPTLVAVDGNNFVGELRRQVDTIDSSVALRVGLPFNTQLEISAPYRHVELHEEQRIDGGFRSATDRSGSGDGDVRVGLVAQLLAEGSWRPNLIGRLDWLTGSGKDADGSVGLGGGHEGIAARLSASWRRDPVVFLLGVGYTGYADSDAGEVQPGDRVDLSLGAALAVSPETALTFSLDQSFAREFSLDGVTLPGTDRRSSVLNISASTIVARGVLLRLTAGMGLTEDAPDYQLGISLPTRIGF